MLHIKRGVEVSFLIGRLRTHLFLCLFVVFLAVDMVEQEGMYRRNAQYPLVRIIILQGLVQSE